MPTLTRRRDPDRTDCWLVHYGDVHVGSVARRSGNRTTKTLGNGAAGSIPAQSPAKSPQARRRRSSRPARTLEKRGKPDALLHHSDRGR
jgi:hypothetical protein